MIRRALALLAVCTLGACSGALPRAATVSGAPQPLGARPAATLRGATIGFNVDTPDRAATAQREGITATILYGSAPGRGTALTRALAAHRIAVIDGGVSSLLFRWECYRTLTVKPPPKGYTWCSPSSYSHTIATTAELLRAVKTLLAEDAKKSYVVGYWVLDDWPWWDWGSAHDVLPQVRAAIAAATPGRPAICGFGAALGRPGQALWDPGVARNYSNAGCDAVGWYNYSPFGIRHPSKGRGLDWSMKTLLPAMAKTLERLGWHIRNTPLLGIGQAWSGSYGPGDYQPGLSAEQMVAQAGAFCRYGATSIGWWAWDDGEFNAATQTPNDSKVIANGLADGIAACRSIWR
ncbi:MAG TPA: hypothetical protein VMF61_02355 [Candidatus Acidoferrales bacterium]|nr:hypothetical protein [Candidatus Acidoferrales bacterium]